MYLLCFIYYTSMFSFKKRFYLRELSGKIKKIQEINDCIHQYFNWITAKVEYKLLIIKILIYVKIMCATFAQLLLLNWLSILSVFVDNAPHCYLLEFQSFGNNFITFSRPTDVSEFVSQRNLLGFFSFMLLNRFCFNDFSLLHTSDETKPVNVNQSYNY